VIPGRFLSAARISWASCRACSIWATASP